MTTDLELLINLDALDESDAFRVFSAMSDKFGWAGTIFTRNDVESMLDTYDPEHDGKTISEFTDEQWVDFTNNKDWFRYVPEWMTEQGWDIIQDVLNDWLKARGLLK